jgi:hypothetical protein
MRLDVYRVTEATEVPEIVYLMFDSLDDRYLAAFENYPGTIKLVIVAWGTTGEVEGEPLAVLIATQDNIITGYVDTYFDDKEDEEELRADGLLEEGEEFVPIEHDEPDDVKRRAALLARLRRVTKAPWLLVHDADEVDGWTEQGFVAVEPPSDVAEAVQVLAWGKLPADASTLLRVRGLAWDRDRHRGFVKDAE